MKVLVLTNCVGHEIQCPVFDAADKLGAEKKQFGEMLRKTVEQQRVQFIGEEASYAWETTMARELGVCWKNIDMPLDERKRRGIFEEQQQRGCVPKYLGRDAKTKLLDEGYQQDVGDGWVQLQPRLPSDAIREQFMFDSVQQNAGGKDSVLVICGIMHGEKLAERFRQTGAAVEVQNWP